MAIILAITHQKSPLQFLEVKKKRLKSLPNFWECNASRYFFRYFFKKKTTPKAWEWLKINVSNVFITLII
ncbi:TPA: hypothetical protein U1V26_001540 [Streptococcus suis]|uniref:hypothetical protein n=1 Tax=Streptococcus suis TaxID=1307 RepID=UPI001ABEB8BE|nr:hypothetical protein [Streptococcus suis]MBO3757239.1 hypothetical protein [Streptococcus suis]HEL1648829.1 hypothetical protein [Streptococcus suis]HEM3518434.1 hypothetical protein [Streptococcus suis]HEM3520408.1 hypothetical protein [Streptococcus suis]HEM3528997.1 hypothetical protein [Streptococcus suis]